MRNDLARPRARFRLREDGTLETKACARCTGVLYRVDAGMWLHWATLEEGCPREASVTVEKVAFGPRVGECGPYPGDSPERGLARARCNASYRRPSWEWMACG